MTPYLTQPPTKPTRKHFTKQRRALSPQQRKQLARAASQHLPRLQPLLPKHAKIAIYYDDFGELPTQPIVDWCKKLSYNLYLPVVGSLGHIHIHKHGNHTHNIAKHNINNTNNTGNKRLRFAPMQVAKLVNLPTYTHPLGMQQHRHRSLLWAKQLDVIFCPLVAVDEKGTRMGMGGGYYDRTLETAHQFCQRGGGTKKPLKIGWCYEFQVVERLTKQAWDVPMDMVMTESRVRVVNDAFK